MTVERIGNFSRKRAHRLVLLALISLLVAFSLWSVWLLVRSQSLRGEVDLYFGWLDEIGAVRQSLEELREPGREPAPELDEFRRRAARRSLEVDDPALQVALRKLSLDLAALEDDPSGGADAPDALWQASVAALSAAQALEAEVREHVARLHQELDGHWRAVRLLVLGALLLAASNLALVVAVQRRRLELETAHRRALRSSRHDPLTGLWNREGILRLLGHELNRASRSGTPIGVILADLDNFTAVNELVGQAQGDYVLEQVAERLRSLVRPYDTMGRFGGDSFLLVLPSCDATATEQVCERLRESVNQHEIEHAFGRIHVTLNIAQLTVEDAETMDVDTLLRRLQEGIDVSKSSIPRPEF